MISVRFFKFVLLSLLLSLSVVGVHQYQVDISKNNQFAVDAGTNSGDPI